MTESGKKTLECRVNYPSLRSIKKGEQVKFFWEKLSLIVEIVDIRYYKTFKEMLSKEDVEKLVPGMSSEQALSEYESIYPDWKVKTNGGLVVFETKIVRKG
jgi:ASC-1-like (ASCH) protein